MENIAITPQLLRAQAAAFKNLEQKEEEGKDTIMQPKFTDDPDAWELYWQTLDKLIQPHTLFRPGELGAGGRMAITATEENLWQLERNKHQLCRYLGVFMREVISRNDVPEYPRLWRTLSRKSKKSLVQRGFYAAEMMTDESGYRGHCPELTYENLVDRRGFLDLFNAFIESSIQFPEDNGFREIVNPHFDAFESIQRDGISQHMTRGAKCRTYNDILRRHSYLLFFVIGVLYPYFLGITEMPPDMRSPLEELPADLDPTIRQSLEETLTKLEAEAEAVAAAYKAGACCWCMQVDVRQVFKLEKAKDSFSHCSRCLKVGRKVPYCSRNCQVLDYPKHKVVCGRDIGDVLPAPVFLPADKPPMQVSVRWQLIRQTKPILYHVFCCDEDAEDSECFFLELASEKEHLWDDFHRDFGALAYFSDSKENRLKLAGLILFIVEHADSFDVIGEASLVRQFSRDFVVERKKLKKAVRELRG